MLVAFTPGGIHWAHGVEVINDELVGFIVGVGAKSAVAARTGARG